MGVAKGYAYEEAIAPVARTTCDVSPLKQGLDRHQAWDASNRAKAALGDSEWSDKGDQISQLMLRRGEIDAIPKVVGRSLSAGSTSTSMLGSVG